MKETYDPCFRCNHPRSDHHERGCYWQRYGEMAACICTGFVEKEERCAEKPAPGIYQHFKGKLYEVIGVAILAETEDVPEILQAPMAVYRQLYGDYGLRFRRLSEFSENVVSAEHNWDGPRFKLVQAF